MGLESTIVCVDNSDFMRNGDFIPSRFAAQQDAVSLVCHSKTRSHPENNVGLMTMTSGEVLVTLTSDVGRILSKLHQVQPRGNINFGTAVKIAHLALKHRLGRNHKPRIVAFVGSPVADDEKELVKMAKRLKKEKVHVDVINFGEQEENTTKLEAFINTLNGKDGSSSHLVTVSSGPTLSDALASSPIVAGEDGAAPAGFPAGGAGFDMGFDPNEDAELALALRMSMEEQRARQAAETQQPQREPTAVAAPGTGTAEDAMLEQALTMSMQPEDSGLSGQMPDFAAMTEEDQIAYALRMSMAPPAEEQAMDTEETAAETETMETAPEQQETGATASSETPAASDDFADVVNDPEFLQNVLESLPGVDPNSEAIRSTVTALATKGDDKAKKEEKDKDGQQ